MSQLNSVLIPSSLPAPNENMEKMDWFLGVWDVLSEMKTEDGWHKDTCKTQHTSEMGGHLIFEHFVGSLRGEPIEAWSLRTFDTNSGHWEQRWIDTSPGGFAHWAGTTNETGYIGYTARFADAYGNLNGEIGVREVFDEITSARFEWRLEQTKDSGESWQVVWKLHYQRAGA